MAPAIAARPCKLGFTPSKKGPVPVFRSKQPSPGPPPPGLRDVSPRPGGANTPAAVARPSGPGGVFPLHSQRQDGAGAEHLCRHNCSNTGANLWLTIACNARSTSLTQTYSARKNRRTPIFRAPPLRGRVLGAGQRAGGTDDQPSVGGPRAPHSHLHVCRLTQTYNSRENRFEPPPPLPLACRPRGRGQGVILNVSGRGRAPRGGRSRSCNRARGWSLTNQTLAARRPGRS